MSEQIKVVRVVSTGALIPLHDNNRIILQREGVVESLAERCPDTGKLIEINGADYSTMVSASNDLKRIGDALINNRRQRDQLIAAAIRQPGGEQFIQTIGVLDDELYVQHVDPETLQLPAHVQTVSDSTITDVTDDLKKAQAKKSSKAKGKSKSSSDDAMSL